MRVAFQGEKGSYSEEAGYAYFDNPEMVPQRSFDDVFSEVASGKCQSGLIPIENSLAGSIHQNYDLLLRHDLYIVGEYLMRIRHCLIGLPGAKLSKINHVISHPQALGQCAKYLRQKGIKPEPVYDTAGSVKMLKSIGEKTTGAIASKIAADIYEMGILAENIEDNSENYTRFLEIAPRAVHPNNEAKTSIVFTLQNVPGALFKAMSAFALRDIDLTKIESRPLQGKAWEYLFYIDFIGAIGMESTDKALNHLKEYAPILRILGSYPRFHA